jgi:hypothetical protein
VDEQPGQSQKYSARLDFEPSVGSRSRRKSFPSVKYRNEAEHEGLLHFATMTSAVLSEFLCWLRRPPRWDEVIFSGSSRPCADDSRRDCHNARIVHSLHSMQAWEMPKLHLSSRRRQIVNGFDICSDKCRPFRTLDLSALPFHHIGRCCGHTH